MSVEWILTRAAQRWLDRHARAPRIKGFSVDDGLPDRGTRRYGGAQTIHNTGTIDVMLTPDGEVAEVWFRCQMLPFHVSEYRRPAVVTDPGPAVIAVELVDP